MTDTISSERGLFADCWTEEQFADQRKVSTRTLRAERQRGEGPAYLKVSRLVFYPIPKAREWLEGKVHESAGWSPRRAAERAARKAPKHVPAKTTRKRTLELAE